MKLLATSLFFLLLFKTTTFAVTFLDHQVPDHVTVDGKELILNGVGAWTVSIAFIEIKVYLGSLYLDKKSKDAKEIISSPSTKYLGMKYLRSVAKAKLVDGWTKSFKESGADTKKFKISFNKFISSITDMSAEEETNITFYPERGIQVTNKGIRAEFIEDKEFATALLNVWFTKASDQDLKDGLLGIKN